METLLSLKDLQFRAQGSSILNGVSFDIRQGETVGIIGPNGSGKTSLFNCISGFYRPTGGTITFHDSDVTHMQPHGRARLGMGRVFQNFGIFREMTVMENMTIALESRQKLRETFLPWARQNKINRETSLGFLKEVDLDGKAGDKASSLSGGQMRLLEIMRTLAFGADLFLLDEPTAGVSPKLKGSIAELIIRLQKANKTVLVIEHDITFIQKFCSRVIVLNVGKVLLDDTPEKVRANPVLQELYFGSHEGANG